MKKFIIHGTRWIKNGRKVGYFRDYNEFVETDDIISYIRKNYTMAFGVRDKKKTFCSAVEVEDYLNISYKYIEKRGGICIWRGDNNTFSMRQNNSKYLGKYDYKLKGWM